MGHLAAQSIHMLHCNLVRMLPIFLHRIRVRIHSIFEQLQVVQQLRSGMATRDVARPL